MPHLFNWLYTLITEVLLAIHSGLSHVLPAGSGAAWGLSIILLTVLIRLLLFPLFVKQIRTQRHMQELSPQINELKKKYKNDKQRMNQEVMALYREKGANPLMGCMPLLLQSPFFWALYHVLRHLGETNASAIYGWSTPLITSFQHAKVFGVPLAVSFSSSHGKILEFGGSPGAVKVIVPIFIVVMAATTFLTQRQIMSRNSAQGNPMAKQMKTMMYVLPPMFALFGFEFPMGYLLYWVTSNVWSMGQQFFVIRSMHKEDDKPTDGKGGGGGPTGGGGDGPHGSGTVVVRRQQTTRQPRRKRSGNRPGRPRPERPGRPR